MNKIRILVVDDSALVRQVLSQGLSQDPELEVVGTANDPYDARDKIVQLNPDVLTLDIEMPRMDGVEFLRRLMPQFPLPVVIVSSLSQHGAKVTLDALEAGAVDYVAKPTTDVMLGLQNMMQELQAKVKIAARIDVSHWKGRKYSAPTSVGISKLKTQALAQTTDKVVAIGSSTGGTEAIRQILVELPPTFPGVVIVQHMPPGFTNTFANRLNAICPMEVKEAKSGDLVSRGRVLIAPGDQHMEVKRSGGVYKVHCYTGEKVQGHCPSVEVLFKSVASQVGANAVGVMLTGMGKDGAQAMLEMRNAGARTFAQDEKSCVVFGMPKVAYQLGGVEKLVPLDEIAQTMMKVLIG
ncbi:chemotaxis response regulator protein-glutamate methylesterase [Deltaproteobacteria bacterium TL4]